MHKSKSDKRTAGPKEPKMVQKHPRECPKTTPRRRKWHHKRPKMTPRRTEEGPKTIPNGKTTKRTEPSRSQDCFGPTHGPISPVQRSPPGSIWEAQTATKSIPKRAEIEAKIEEQKTSIQDDLGPVLERSWVVLGRHLARKNVWNR